MIFGSAVNKPDASVKGLITRLPTTFGAILLMKVVEMQKVLLMMSMFCFVTLTLDGLVPSVQAKDISN